MRKSSIKTDALVIGFALFAMFFGAGNLIFPTFVGMKSGTMWFTGFVVFFIVDIVLAFLTIIAMINGDGTIGAVTGVIGKKASILLSTVMMICIGPLIAIPRTGALTYGMTFKNLIPHKTTLFTAMIGAIVYFGITYILSVKPGKVVDIVGKFLTPVMVVLLLVMIAIGVIKPLSGVQAPNENVEVVATGITNGYQTMDVLGGLGLAMIVCATVSARGYKKKKERTKITAMSCSIAGILLFLVYGGLAYLGATYAAIGDPSILNADVVDEKLVIAIADGLLGSTGVTLLGVIVGLACLTTSVGLTSAVSSYFEEVTNGKLKYEKSVLAICVFSAVLACVGVGNIVKFAGPILSIIYPVVIILIVMSFFRKQIRNDNVFKGACLFALVISTILVIHSTFKISALDFMEMLPLHKLGLSWILPAVLGGMVGSLFRKKSSALSSDLSNDDSRPIVAD